MQDKVAIWGEIPKVTPVGATLQVKPAGFEAEGDRPTVPVNPLTAVTVIVWVPSTPTVVLTVTGEDGAIVKSTTWKSMLVVECVREAVVPVTITVWSPPALETQVRVNIWGEVPNTTFGTGRLQASPVCVGGDNDRFTVPVNPFRAVSVIVEVAIPPASIVLGLTVPAEMVKSGAGLTVIMKVFDLATCFVSPG